MFTLFNDLLRHTYVVSSASNNRHLTAAGGCSTVFNVTIARQLTFMECVFSGLQSGPALDALVRERLPDPWLVRGALSSSLERELLRNPGLKGRRIVAASTAKKQLLADAATSDNQSVRRASVYNCRLKPEHANEIAHRAVVEKDGATILALIDGRDDFGTLLEAEPKMPLLVSPKEDHPAHDLVARRLLLSSEADARSILANSHIATRFPDTAQKARSLMLNTSGSSDEVARLVMSATSSPYHHNAARIPIRRTGARTSTVASLMDSASPSLRRSVLQTLTKNPLLPVSEIMHLMSVSLDEAPLSTWTEQALRITAKACAHSLRTHASLTLFEQFLPEWTASLNELLAVSGLGQLRT